MMTPVQLNITQIESIAFKTPMSNTIYMRNIISHLFKEQPPKNFNGRTLIKTIKLDSTLYMGYYR